MVDLLDRENLHLFLERMNNKGNSFIANVNILAGNIEAIKNLNNILTQEEVDALFELFTKYDVGALLEDLAKGSLDGYRKLDIQMLYNMADFFVGMDTQERNDLWNTIAKQVYYQSVVVEFEDGTRMNKTFHVLGDNSTPTTIHTHQELYAQFTDWDAFNEKLTDTQYAPFSDGDLGDWGVMRFFDAQPNFSNLIRVTLTATPESQNLTKNNTPTYTWEMSSSSLEIITQQLGPILRLSDHLDTVVALSDIPDRMTAVENNKADKIITDTQVKNLSTVYDELLPNTIKTVSYDAPTDTMNFTRGNDVNSGVIIPIVNDINNGLMAVEDRESIIQLRTDLDSLSSGGIWRQTFETYASMVTAYPGLDVSATTWLQNDFVYVDSDENRNPTVPPTTSYVVVVDGTTKTLEFRKLEGSDITTATNATLGVVKGSTMTDGKIFVETDGTQSVNGWDTLNNTVAGKVDNSQYQADLASGKYDGNPLGTLIWSTTGIVDNGYLDASIDHGPLQRSQYPEMYAKIQRAYDEGITTVLATDTEWLAERNSHIKVEGDFGIGKYSLGDGVTTFRIPIIKKVTAGANPRDNIKPLGTFVEDEIRPITGIIGPVRIGTNNLSYSGSFYPSSTVASIAASGTSINVPSIHLDSSLLGSQYRGKVSHSPIIIITPLIKVYGTQISVSTVEVGATADIPIFTPVVRLFNTPSPGYLFCTVDNGILSGDVYPDAYNELVALQTNGDANVVSMSAYLEHMNSNGEGVTGRFALDTATKTFRIPCMPASYWRGKTSDVSVGGFQNDQMRPIIGEFANIFGDNLTRQYGALIQFTDQTGGSPFNIQVSGGYTHGRGQYKIDTSLLGFPYSGTDTHPKSVVTHYQMKLYNQVTGVTSLNFPALLQNTMGKLDVSEYEPYRIRGAAIVQAGGTLLRSIGITSSTRVGVGRYEITYPDLGVLRYTTALAWRNISDICFRCDDQTNTMTRIQTYKPDSASVDCQFFMVIM